MLLPQFEFNKSVHSPFVGVNVLTAKDASFMVWACVCLGGHILSRFPLVLAVVLLGHGSKVGADGHDWGE